MSSGPACKNHSRESWVVAQRQVNHSAFNGYRPTPSEWSEVWCTSTDGPHRDGPGGSHWRTKAAYVDDLPDAKPDDRPG